MSMISSLIDELNKSADEWNGSNMFELARMCREAADTITELRGALQVASVDYRHLQDENAKLREQLEGIVGRSFRTADKMSCLEAENAKLRELVEDMHAALQAFCDAQDVHGDNCPLWVERTDDCELRGIERRMSELRVEVDE